MNEKEFDTMNVIPLVDVMLVLLTIVLTTASFIATGAIPVDLPQTEKRSSPKVQRERTIIEINSEGEIFLASVRISLEELKRAVADLPRSTVVEIRADRRISLQVFVSVLETVQKQGLEQVTLQTEESL